MPADYLSRLPGAKDHIASISAFDPFQTDLYDLQMQQCVMCPLASYPLAYLIVVFCEDASLTGSPMADGQADPTESFSKGQSGPGSYCHLEKCAAFLQTMVVFGCY